MYASIAKKILGRFFLPRFYRTPFIYGPLERLTIGKNASLVNTIFNTRSGSISVGNNVIFSYNAMVLTGYHDVRIRGEERIRPTLTEAKRDVIIEDGAWIAAGVIVIGPVRIGRNSVVGSGSVVVNDIPPDVFAAGNPARVIKPIDYREDAEKK